jgi:hypothetical protein
MDETSAKLKRFIFIFITTPKMQTLLFIASENPRHHGFQLSRENLYRVPAGRIHIARYSASFDPVKGRGYYGDIYMRQFIRLWKKTTMDKKRRLMERRWTALCMNVLCSRPTTLGDREVLITDVIQNIGNFI